MLMPLVWQKMVFRAFCLFGITSGCFFPGSFLSFIYTWTNKVLATLCASYNPFTLADMNGDVPFCSLVIQFKDTT